MKFLCDNCKAKYQIGDDKVAGKAVRMKCRRCGHDIHVSASQVDAGRPVEGPTFTGSVVVDGPSSITPAPESVPPTQTPPRAAPSYAAKPNIHAGAKRVAED